MQPGLPEFLKTRTVLLEKPSTQFGFHLPEKVWNSKKLERRQVSYKLEVENFQSLAILIILHVTGCHFEMRKICHIAHVFHGKIHVTRANIFSLCLWSFQISIRMHFLLCLSFLLIFNLTFGTKYPRMHQVKFVEISL